MLCPCTDRFKHGLQQGLVRGQKACQGPHMPMGHHMKEPFYVLRGNTESGAPGKGHTRGGGRWWRGGQGDAPFPPSCPAVPARTGWDAIAASPQHHMHNQSTGISTAHSACEECSHQHPRAGAVAAGRKVLPPQTHHARGPVGTQRRAVCNHPMEGFDLVEVAAPPDAAPSLLAAPGTKVSQASLGAGSPSAQGPAPTHRLGAVACFAGCHRHLQPHFHPAPRAGPPPPLPPHLPSLLYASLVCGAGATSLL